VTFRELERVRLSGCAVEVNLAMVRSVSSYLMQRRTISNMIASHLYQESLGTFAIRLPLFRVFQQGRNVLVLQLLLCRRYGHHTSQPRRRDRRLRLIASHFRRFGLTIHTVREKETTRKRRPFTFRGLDRNHRLVTWRTSKSTTTLCPSASSSNT
jgi:hypothetical protein